jgi:hypothetical protein
MGEVNPKPTIWIICALSHSIDFFDNRRIENKS